jgi:serine/threonine-protein kinase
MTRTIHNRMPRVGDVIAGKYRLERVLGSGAVGQVIRAHHLVLDHPVAVKLVACVADVSAAARIRSENVVRIFDVDVLPNGVPYVVTEYLEGCTLRSLASRGPLAPNDVARWLAQACNALAEARDAGVVHRDITPERLFLTRGKSGEEIVKVLDLGLGGCGRYANDDAWSVAVTIYELLTGVPLRLACTLHASFPPLRAIRPDVSLALESIVMGCLSGARDHQFSDVRALGWALEASVHAPSSPPEALPILRQSPPPPAARGAFYLRAIAGPLLTAFVAGMCVLASLAVSGAW